MPKTLRSSLLTFGGAGILLLLLFLAANRVHAAPTVASGIIQGRVTDGSYRLTVPPGTYFVAITNNETANPGVYVSKYYPNAPVPDIAAAQQLTVTSNTLVDHIDVQLDRYGVLKGSVSDDQGQPLTTLLEVEVYKFDSDTASRGFHYNTVVSADLQGRYQVNGLAAGVYKLFFHDRHIPAQVQSEFFGHTTVVTTAQEINLQLNQVATNLNISLKRKPDVAPFRLTQLASAAPFPGKLLGVNTSYQLIYSQDGGHKWLTLPLPNPAVTGVELVAIASTTNVTQPVRLLATTGNTIYRTGDLGASWAKQTIADRPECNRPGRILSLNNQPTQPNHLSGYAFCAYDKDGLGQTTYYYSEFHSDDGGVTWVQNPISDYPNWTSVIDRNHPASLYRVIFEGDGSQPDAFSYFLQASNDAGQTWGAKQPLTFCGAHLPNQDHLINQLYWLPASNGVLVLACKNGLFRSVDQGATWTQAKLALDNVQEFYTGFAVDEGHPGRLLWERDTGLWASDDLGDTWTQLTQHYEANQLYLPRIAHP